MATNNTQNIRKGLGNLESRLLASFSHRGKEIFILKDVTKELNCSNTGAKLLVNGLVKKKWLIPINRGVYLIVPLAGGIEGKYMAHEFVVASYFAKDYYIGYWSALNFHGLTEQIPSTIFVAITTRLKNRKIMGVNYKFATLKNNKFFGFEKVNVGNKAVNISNVEKTIVDCLDRPELCGGIAEVAGAIKKSAGRLNEELLIKYFTKMKNGAVMKRFGYLAKVLSLKLGKKLSEKIKSAKTKGFTKLDTLLGGGGRFNTEFNIIVNISEESLRG